MSQLQSLKQDLRKLIKPDKKEGLQRFFKTGKGEYGEDDKFIGVMVPQSKSIAKKYKNLPLEDVIELLHSQYHEERLIALEIMKYQFSKASEEVRKKIYDLYLSNTKYINNWDLVDTSAGHIVGDYLMDKPRDILYKLAKSNDLWKKRIAMLSTFRFIVEKENEDAFKIAEILLHDEHDLIHKAVGWMLKEIGKRSGLEIEEEFLKKHYKEMPRTMLRYSLEKFPEEKRKLYMS